MSTRYVGRRLHEVSFQLYDKVLHPEYFTVWKEKRLATASCRTTIWLVEGGHILSVATEEDAVTEVFAGLDWDLPERGRFTALPLADCTRKSYRRASGEIYYDMSFRVLRLSREEFLRKELEILSRKSPARLFSTFSEEPKGPSLPFSLVDYVPGPETLAARAVHSYPEEYTFIETRSELRLRLT